MKTKATQTKQKMKKYLFMVAFAALLGVNNSTSYAQVVRKGNTFSSVQQTDSRTSTPPQKTKYVWEEKEGKYPIYISPKSGACFINKVSKKSGKEYRKYLSEDVCRPICREMKIEYKPKNK